MIIDDTKPDTWGVDVNPEADDDPTNDTDSEVHSGEEDQSQMSPNMGTNPSSLQGQLIQRYRALQQLPYLEPCQDEILIVHMSFYIDLCFH